MARLRADSTAADRRWGRTGEVERIIGVPGRARACVRPASRMVWRRGWWGSHAAGGTLRSGRWLGNASTDEPSWPSAKRK
ncbi:hypothetical protein G6F40_017735 [Rhizopus arrhizus]|nr:hypothetical protein G6F40_017735 [Rhizopus arrhizus]KAG1247487.1 hypothetical protein G6F68_014179 [Rhizopus microsporus]